MRAGAFARRRPDKARGRDRVGCSQRPWHSSCRSYSLSMKARSRKRGSSEQMGNSPLMEPRTTASASGPLPLNRSTHGSKERQFLATKVVPPRCPGLIERSRLLSVTSQLASKRLAVLKAPAGFGKTSLAVSWFQRLQESGNAVAWLATDPDDDEPPAFLFYVAHALQRACEGVGATALELIRESFLINPRAIISTLINDLADVDDEVYLILEDYHWLANPEIHEAVAFFLKRAPSHCHVLLTTRTEPPLLLASFRAQNQLLEIDASAFRFDLQETQTFIENEKPGTLVPSEVRLLHEKTEGWPAALEDRRVYFDGVASGLQAVCAQSLRHARSEEHT